VQLYKLTGLAEDLNAALDAGKSIPLDAVSAAMEARTVLDFLKGKLGNDLDLSLWDNDDRIEMQNEWHSMDNAIDPARKLGVRRNGLCLLIAFILEGVRHRWEPLPGERP
jgi:hypothetical protein